VTGILLPVVLVIAGLLAAVSAYRGIRRGGARFYTLEREAILRRAGLSLMVSVALFLAAAALLFYQRQQYLETLFPPEPDAALTPGEQPTITPTFFLESAPPSPTVGTPQPTPSATPMICRGVVEGTSGNGLTLRDAPSGAEIQILAEGALLTVLDDPPTEANGTIWRKIRAVGGDEGWVAEDYITIRAPCGGAPAAGDTTE
jgi:hypothetical protein